MRPSPLTLVAQARCLLQYGMAVNEIRTVQESLAHRRQLGDVKIVDQFLAGGIHLRTDIERQVKFAGLSHDLVQLLQLQAAHIRVGDVPIAVRDDI